MALDALHIPRPQTPEQVQTLFVAQRRGDRVGHAIHLALALGGCFFTGWSTSYAEWCMLPVLICFLVRMTGQHRVLEPLAHDRVVRLWVAWGAWAGLSVLWSYGRAPGVHEWLNDVQSLRFFALPLVLWPVMDRRNWLIAAVVAGIACGQLSQNVHLATISLHTSWMPYHREMGRITGWWDPAVSGSILCAGLGFWLSAGVFGKTVRARMIGATGSLATLGCIALTGTRGAWIGAALLLGIACWMLLRRSRSQGFAIGAVAAVALAAGTLGVGAWMYVADVKDPSTLPGIAQRLRHGVDEVRGALGPHGYESDTGLRIAMWRWGWAALRTHPLFGVGAGGYRPWVQSRTEEEAAELHAPAGAIKLVHSHAHSWYVHTFATLGVIGGALLLWLVGTAILAGLRGSHDSGLFACGPPMALLGLACAGLFDSITINQQTALLFFVLLALCLPCRPREAGTSDTGGTP
jgi:O-antigen ligase